MIGNYIAPTALSKKMELMLRGLHPRLCYFAFTRLFWNFSPYRASIQHLLSFAHFSNSEIWTPLQDVVPASACIDSSTLLAIEDALFHKCHEYAFLLYLLLVIVV